MVCINSSRMYKQGKNDGNIFGLNDHEVQIFCEILTTSVQDELWIKSPNIYKVVYTSKIITDIVSL